MLSSARRLYKRPPSVVCFVMLLGALTILAFFGLTVLFEGDPTALHYVRPTTPNWRSATTMNPPPASILGDRSVYSPSDIDFAQHAGIYLVPPSTTEPLSTGDPSSSSSLLSLPPEDGSVRVRAVIVMLARNTDLKGANQSVSMLQDRFNKHYHYPYVFLNDVPFDEEFKEAMRAITPGSEVQFGLVPKEHWSYPDWIDQNRAAEVRRVMKLRNIVYGDRETYRFMCRYFSGFFFRHPLLQKYDYYWRVEPMIEFTCDIPFDPFRFMQENNKLYSFTISRHEYAATIPTLWETARTFRQNNPDLVREENALRWLGNDPARYNGCHFWSNFEIASFHLWRSEAYLRYFEHLDRAGGFFYERWGDAPVHTIGATMLLKPDQIHFFNEIGYFHSPCQHCPVNRANYCSCDPKISYDFHWDSCTGEWFDLFVPGGRKALQQ